METQGQSKIRHTRMRDRILGVGLELHIWRWHGVPVMFMLSIGSMVGKRPPWHATLAWVGIEVLSFAQVVWHLQLVTAKW